MSMRLAIRRNSGTHWHGRAKIGRRSGPQCKEAAGAWNYSIEQLGVIGHVSHQGAMIGFGFQRSASPDAAILRCGKIHAVLARALRNAHRTRRPVGGQRFSRCAIYREERPATMASYRELVRSGVTASGAMGPILLGRRECSTGTHTSNAWNGRVVGA
jgi:hypothetical protein